MRETTKEIFLHHEIRKTKAQKSAFRDYLTDYAKSKGYDAKVERAGKNAENVIVGDPTKAKVVYTAHYDTCAVMPLPNFITPKCLPIYLLYQIVLSLIIYIIPLSVMISSRIIYNATDSYPLFLLLLLGGYALLIGVTFLLIMGPANKHTANDNTSGVITLCEIMDRLPEELKEKAAFVFFDHEETGLFGSQYFRKKNKKKMQTKLLINFDCVSDGDYIMFASTKDARKTYGEAFRKSFVADNGKTILMDKLEKVYYPSDHAGFPVALAVAALKRKKYIGYYIDRIHTARDTMFDTKNIDLLCSCMHNFLETL